MIDSPPLIPARSTLAIIGAGPIGLETAARAASLNWNFVLFEKAVPGHHIRQWGHIRLFSPFRMNHSSWGLGLLSRAYPDRSLPPESAYLTGHEFVQQYLEPLARLPEVRDHLFTGVEVVEIGKDQIAKKDSIGKLDRLNQPFRMLLRVNGREIIHRSQAVVDASGVYSCPQFLGNGNIPAPGERQAREESSSRLQYGAVDLLGENQRRFKNETVLLVGGGHTAATALEGFLQLVESAPRTRVFWVHRSCRDKPYFRFPNDPLPYRDHLSRLGNQLAAQPPSWLRYFPESSLEAFLRWPKESSSGEDAGRFELLIHSPQGQHKVEVDRILACVGFRPDNSLYRQLQVHECYATTGPIKLAASLLGASADCLAQPAQGIETLKNPEPNFFVLGNKSYGTHTTFLLTHGMEQIETVMNYLKVGGLIGFDHSSRGGQRKSDPKLI